MPRGRQSAKLKEPVISKFKCGDTVQLHSGGPLLMVTDTSNGDVDIAWFDQGLVLRHEVTPQDCLKLVRAASSPNLLAGAVADATEKPQGYVEISES